MKRLLSGTGWFVGFLAALATYAAQFKFPNQTLTVPDGFEVELAAKSPLVDRPISASFDEQGRLYVTDSSGSNDKPDKQLEEKPHRIVRLEDTDGDGKFDKTTVFADKIMFPEGCLWYDGALYVSAPPSIWKLTDTNNDGVADVRVEWHQGKTLTGCANDLHGPYLGLDGWIYWCKGAFASQTYERPGMKPFVSRAAHIFRSPPDHSLIEPVLTGGMDNPVGVAFTPEGERILCGTFFVTHEPGHRDGLIHAIYGGVYGKINDVTDDAPKTGDLMPVMTQMGPAAPCSVIRYESREFGDNYRDNLFVCSFNLHKVTRHILEPAGATFRTKDSDFLTSDSTDFHPTDVIEDADGSLLVVDTGGWYKICCPTSQLSKPDLLGAIYRIRWVGAPKQDDPRGLKLAWAKMKPAELTALLSDERVFVQRRAIQELAKRGDRAVPALRQVVESGPKQKVSKGRSDSYREQGVATRAEQWPNGAAKRQKALWALTRIDSERAREAVRLGLKDADTAVRCVALQSASLHRDRKAADAFAPESWLVTIPVEERLYFELLGRTGSCDDRLYSQTHLLIDNIGLRPSVDRALQHSFSYALIESDAAKTARSYLSIQQEAMPAALIALDQMEDGGLKPGEVIPYLSATLPDARKAAFWVVSHHPEWGSELTGFFRERVTASRLTDSQRNEVEHQLAQFAHSEAIQDLMASLLGDPTTPSAARQVVLRAMALAALKESPANWTRAVRSCLAENDNALLDLAVVTARVLAQARTNAPNFSEPLLRIAREESRPTDLRLEAMAALPNGLRSVEPETLTFLCENVEPAKPVMTRSVAASVLAKAKLKDEQLLILADTLQTAGPLEITKLLAAFERCSNEAVGLKLVATLKESKSLSSLRTDLFRALIAKYPASVQQQGGELLATLNVDTAKQSAHLDELLAELKNGDTRRGQTVFNSPKAACFSCHAMGYQGGHVGPDLTKIGEVRTERDLLEAIVYPSASFVRSYEPMIVQTKSDEQFNGVLRKDAPDEVVLATGPDTEVSIPRSDIAEMRPGTISIMPAGLEQQLTTQELADLLAFLKATKWGPR